MANSSASSYIGKIVSLISTAAIRYEGTISMINNDKITLKNVRIFGTEDRKCEVYVEMLKDIRPSISFNRSGIRSISIISQYTFFDPSIVEQTMESTENPSSTENKESEKISLDNTQNVEKETNKNFRRNYKNNQAETIEEPVRNDFDFEESNKKFDKDNESVDVTAPAYKKDDFFDSLQEHDTKESRPNRRVDEETFGKRSIQEHARENRSYKPRNNRGNQRYGHKNEWRRSNRNNSSWNKNNEKKVFEPKEN